jgi:DNA-binding GntR family transcriptional regulator
MPYEYTPPKYAQVIDELRRRIESGEYAPGSLLPSEHQLSDEFQIARPTVVRALRVLRQDGWIDTQQGKGSFVRGRPALAGLESQRPGEDALNRDEARETGEPVTAALAIPPARVAALLGTGPEEELLARQRVVAYDGEASEIITWWIPPRLADGTGLGSPEPLHGGVRGHLARRRDIRIDHVLQQVTARHPTAREAALLGTGTDTPMLAMYVTAREASGAAVLVLEVVMPGDRHELEDAYQIS